MHVKWYKSMVQPGEAVGVIAAQSIGEPSTQVGVGRVLWTGRAELWTSWRCTVCATAAVSAAPAAARCRRRRRQRPTSTRCLPPATRR